MNEDIDKGIHNLGIADDTENENIDNGIQTNDATDDKFNKLKERIADYMPKVTDLMSQHRCLEEFCSLMRLISEERYPLHSIPLRLLFENFQVVFMFIYNQYVVLGRHHGIFEIVISSLQ